MTLDQSIEMLREKWRSQGIILRPGASTNDIKAFETRYGVRMPNDLRRVYQAFDGFDCDSRMDDELFSLWPIERVQPLAVHLQEDNAPHSETTRIVFADWSLDAWCFTVVMSVRDIEASPVWVTHSSDTHVPVAISVTEFFCRYADGDVGVIYG